MPQPEPPPDGPLDDAELLRLRQKLKRNEYLTEHEFQTAKACGMLVAMPRRQEPTVVNRYDELRYGLFTKDTP